MPHFNVSISQIHFHDYTVEAENAEQAKANAIAGHNAKTLTAMDESTGDVEVDVVERIAPVPMFVVDGKLVQRVDLISGADAALVSWAMTARPGDINPDNVDCRCVAPTITADALAREFADIVKQELDAGGEFKEMLAANDADPDTSVCHSHDYIDSNMSMLQAWCYLNGIEEKEFSVPNMDSTEGQAMFALWSEAWTLARANRFYVDDPSHQNRART